MNESLRGTFNYTNNEDWICTGFDPGPEPRFIIGSASWVLLGFFILYQYLKSKLKNVAPNTLNS
mgnify:CR=1 FL=1